MYPAGRSHSTVVLYFRTGVCSLHEKIFSWAYSLSAVINKLLSCYEPACRAVLSREGVACWRRHSARCRCSPTVFIWSDMYTLLWMGVFFLDHEWTPVFTLEKDFQIQPAVVKKWTFSDCSRTAFILCIYSEFCVRRSIPPTPSCCKDHGGVENAHVQLSASSATTFANTVLFGSKK